MTKETTLNELGQMLTHVVENMATKDDLAELRTELRAEMAELRTEFGVEMAELRTELRADMATGFSEIMTELTDIKRRLKTVEAAIEDHGGHSKEIDHAFERIAAIERHIGLTAK